MKQHSAKDPLSAPQSATASAPQEKPRRALPRSNRLMPKHAGIGPERGAKQDTVKPARETSSLGSLEAEVLGLLWEIGRPASGMDVMEFSLYKRRGAGQEPISFASIATTLRRLSEKGLLQMEKGEQRTPMYTPLVEREQMAARILNNVSVTLLGHSLRSLLPRLMGITQAGVQKLTPEEQQHIDLLMNALEEVAGGGAANTPKDATS